MFFVVISRWWTLSIGSPSVLISILEMILISAASFSTYPFEVSPQNVYSEKQQVLLCNYFHLGKKLAKTSGSATAETD